MKKFLISDTHNDFLTELASGEIEKYIACCKKENVKTICASYWTSEKNKAEIMKELPLRAELLRGSGYFLHIEDLWWVESKEDLKFLLNLKPFSCSMTWNNRTSLAGGAKSAGGLTAWGRRVLEALLSAGIVVDTAHLNRESFYEAAEIICKNIYCSHAGFYGIRRAQRNLTDKQIDTIVSSGGFIGLFFFDKCVKVGKSEDEFSSSDIATNLEYFVSRWGNKNIGIGSDFFGIENNPKDLKGYSDFFNLAKVLEGRGWSEEQIESVFSGNFDRFLERIK